MCVVCAQWTSESTIESASSKRRLLCRKNLAKVGSVAAAAAAAAPATFRLTARRLCLQTNDDHDDDDADQTSVQCCVCVCPLFCARGQDKRSWFVELALAHWAPSSISRTHWALDDARCLCVRSLLLVFSGSSRAPLEMRARADKWSPASGANRERENTQREDWQPQSSLCSGKNQMDSFAAQTERENIQWPNIKMCLCCCL